ncbi:MAG TPA: DUF1294 domain-containing protein [Bacillales bacterium]|nr:DUF1294 domain-containing protein [Bacillales bacterium]
MANIVIDLIGYVLIINVFALMVMAVDKRKARKEKWRIPEARIWMIAWIGGSPGVWAGMKWFKHKTKHRKFVVGVPLLCFLNIGIYLVVLVLYLA